TTPHAHACPRGGVSPAKPPLPAAGSPYGQPAWLTGLERLDLLGLRALGPLAGGVFDPLVLLQAAVTVGLDGGLVNEDVAGAVVRGDEPVPPVGAEPFHGALSHVPSPGETIFGARVDATPGWRGPPARRAWLWVPMAPAVRISQAL